MRVDSHTALSSCSSTGTFLCTGLDLSNSSLLLCNMCMSSSTFSYSTPFNVSASSALITNGLACFEEEMKAWRIVVDEWSKERAALLRKRDVMKQEINDLKAEIVSLRDRSPCEDGEIVEVKEAIKEEITKAIVETIEIKTKAMAVSIEGKMDAKEEGRR
ncbi:hypothetical protein L7F22_053135 [Adiantum nelumboides]|nr:hypothetical protein [Adiantum nelumboides]